MPTIEERLQAVEREHQVLEREHTQLKKTIELQTIAIGALVNKAALERLNEKYDKIFDALIAHDQFTNQQLAELRGQYTELDGKVVGLQTEMRQRFTNIETEMQQRFANIETEMQQRFTNIETEMQQRFTNIETEMQQRFAEQDGKIVGLQSGIAEHTTLLQQILARLPEKL